MAKAGRKSALEEVKIAQRYADLAEPAFRVILKFLGSDKEIDQKWAVEQLQKGFVKMIPQVLEGDKENPLMVMPIFNGQSVQNNTSNQKGISTDSKD